MTVLVFCTWPCINTVHWGGHFLSLFDYFMPCILLSLLTHPGGWWKYIAENPLELVRKLRKNQTDLTSLRSFLGVLNDGYKLAVLQLWFTCFAIWKTELSCVSLFCFHHWSPVGSVPVKILSLAGHSSVKGWVEATGFGSCKIKYHQFSCLHLTFKTVQWHWTAARIALAEMRNMPKSHNLSSCCWGMVFWLPVGLSKTSTFLTSATIIANELQLRQDFW